MSPPILATKLLFPPPRPNLVARPRLVERLITGLRGPLTLVSAPPGSGKTTLLSEWRAGAGQDAAVAWLSLDASDNDPTCFLAGLIAALDALRPGLAFLGRVLAAQGASPRADALLERVCLMAEGIPNVEVLLQTLALRAAIAGSLHGSADRGAAYLERALDLAAPEGFARPFLDAGSALAKPLRQAIVRGIQPGFAQKLLADLAEEARRGAVTTQLSAISETPGTSRLVEPLTERERQVLRLLAAGLSSNQVAEELVISVSTARSYIKNLYGKLDAHSREEAIERGREHGVL